MSGQASRADRELVALPGWILLLDTLASRDALCNTPPRFLEIISYLAMKMGETG